MTVEVWSDLHESLSTDAQGNIRKVINVDAVLTSLDNILRTSPGERFFLRSFGAGLEDLLFENISDVVYDNYRNRIQNALRAWDNRLIIKTIDFFNKPDENTVTLKITLIIRGYEQIFEYSTNLKT